jgi:XTP/dITP diphosphohydrolase
MMDNELLLASNNAHKHEEFERLFPGTHFLLPRDLGISFGYEENGETFLSNALGKALTLHRQTGRAVMADDSGLCVRALGGEPGIYSNRYGAGADGVPLDAPRRNAYLLERMKGMQDRAAWFVCCLVLVMEENKFLVAQETVHGTITESPRGENGFGYDPLFLAAGYRVTIAELPESEKDEISHRGRAARRLHAAWRGGA